MLTTDKQILKQAISTTHGIWVLVEEYAIVVGGGVASSRHGLAAVLYVLQRTAVDVGGYSNRATKRLQRGTPLVGATRGGRQRNAKAEKTAAQQAEAFGRAGEWSAALKGWAVVRDDAGHPATCHMKLTICHSQLGDLAAALCEAEAALNCFSQPGYEPAVAARKPKKGAAPETREEQIARERGSAHGCRGAARWLLGDLEGAEADFEAVLQLIPGCAAADHQLREVRKRIEAGATGPDASRGASTVTLMR